MPFPPSLLELIHVGITELDGSKDVEGTWLKDGSNDGLALTDGTWLTDGENDGKELVVGSVLGLELGHPLPFPLPQLGMEDSEGDWEGMTEGLALGSEDWEGDWEGRADVDGSFEIEGSFEGIIDTVGEWEDVGETEGLALPGGGNKLLATSREFNLRYPRPLWDEALYETIVVVVVATTTAAAPSVMWKNVDATDDEINRMLVVEIDFILSLLVTEQ